MTPIHKSVTTLDVLEDLYRIVVEARDGRYYVGDTDVTRALRAALDALDASEGDATDAILDALDVELQRLGVLGN